MAVKHEQNFTDAIIKVQQIYSSQVDLVITASPWHPLKNNHLKAVRPCREGGIFHLFQMT